MYFINVSVNVCFVSLSTPLGLNIFGEHLGTFPLARASVWFINPCDSYYDFRMHPGESHQGTLKNKAYYSYPGGYMAHSEPHKEVEERAREGEKPWVLLSLWSTVVCIDSVCIGELKA